MNHKLNIFISHPSDLLTNSQPHGDGLTAFGFISRLAARGHTVHVATPAMSIQGELPIGVKIHPVKLWTKFSTLNPLEYIVKVRQIFDQVCQQDMIDIVHQLGPVELGLSFLLLNTRVPVVLGPYIPSWLADAEPIAYKTSLLGGIAYTFTKPLVEWCDQQQQKQAAALLLCTPAALTRLYEPEVQPSRIHSLPYAIDAHHFHPAETPITQPTILYLAHLSRRKGIFTLLEAFQTVANALPNCQLLIAGSGSEQASVTQIIADMTCRSQVSLLGRVDREHVPALMQQCTLYCMPSYGEPFGMSALEAMASGKPVVGTNAGGLAYLVTEQGGRKVQPGDATGLAQALIEILSSQALQLKMGQYNRALVEEVYSWDQVITKLESIYYQLIADPVSS